MEAGSQPAEPPLPIIGGAGVAQPACEGRRIAGSGTPIAAPGAVAYLRGFPAARPRSSVFNIGMPELILIFVVALLIFGPTKLPELARSLGKGLAEFRRASSDLRSQLLDPPVETRPPAPTPPPPAATPQAAPTAPSAAAGTAAETEAAAAPEGTTPVKEASAEPPAPKQGQPSVG